MNRIFYLLACPFILGAQNYDDQAQFNDPSDKKQFYDGKQKYSGQKIHPYEPSHSYQRESPEQIKEELDAAERKFQKALEIFNPWYTGPLITPGASMMGVGKGNMQPYIFVIDNHAAYNTNRKSVSLDSDLVQLQFASNIQTGITKNFDLNLSYAAFVNWQSGKTGGGYGDMSLEGGFLVLQQSLYIPQIKFTVAQSFPTGKYKNLSFNGLGLNATGTGAYATELGLVISKAILWDTKHPMNMRLFVGYQRSTTANVRNYNTYGGGRGTRGTVQPGDVINLNFGYEFSFTQRWVFATDIVYTSSKQTTFTGIPGAAADGSVAVTGTDYSDNLSLSPALEYNFSPNIGVITGFWVSVYGRNSPDFLSGIISVTIGFP